MSKDSLLFVAYMIHACANKWEVNPSTVYKHLQSVDCITDFLVPNYEYLSEKSGGAYYCLSC